MKHTMKILLGSLFVIALSGAAAVQPAVSAAGQAPPSTDPAAAPAGTYKLDPRHASVTGTMLRQGLSHYAFRFDKIDASFEYDPKNPEASKVTVTIDPTSFDSNTKPIDDMVRGDGFFDVVKFPQITFTSTAIKRTGNKGTMTGNVSFIGFTRPVTLNVTFNGFLAGGRSTMGFSASTVIKISDFGPVGVAFTKLHSLADDVPLDIEVLFDKA